MGQSKDHLIYVNSVPLERRALSRLMRKASRCGVLFRSLKEGELRLLRLVVRLKERVRSFFLAKVLEPLIKRLMDGMVNTPDVVETVLGKITYRVETKGRSLAKKISQIARSWGNKSASDWSGDRGFMQYLSVMDLNKP